MGDGPYNTTVNGKEVSYYNLRVTAAVGGEDGPTISMPDLKDISWQSTSAFGKAGGPGRRFTRRTQGGRVTYTNSCIMYRSGLLALKTQLADLAIARGLVDEDGDALWNLVECTIVVTFSYLAEDVVQKVELQRSVFNDENEKCSEGEAAQEVTLGIDSMKNREKIGTGPWTTMG